MITKKINGKSITFINNPILKRYSYKLDKYFKWMKKLPLENPVIFDIGACIGMYTICYSKIYNNSKIYSFEPVKKNFKQLKKNIELNRLTKVNIHNFGISNLKKNIKIGIPNKNIHKRYSKDINDGLFSIFSNVKKYSIKLDKLDSFVKKKKLTFVDFIKIDVEGAEYLVLEGATKLIRKYQPIIQLEYNEITKSLGKKDILYFKRIAKKYNYKIYYLTKNYNFKKKINIKKDFFSDIIFINNNIKIKWD